MKYLKNAISIQNIIVFRGNTSIRRKLIDPIFNDREAQVQAKDDEIRRLNNLYADTIKDLGEVLMEIERLKESYAAITNNFECAIREIDRLKEQKHNG